MGARDAGLSKSKAASICSVCFRLARAGLESHPLSRVDVYSVDVKNPMKMRAGGATGGTCVAENIAAFHFRAGRSNEAGHVEIHGLETLTVVNADCIAEHVE